MDFTTPLLIFLAFRLPSLIIFVVGFFLAVFRWKKHPQLSLAACSAFVLFAIINLSAVLRSYMSLFLLNPYSEDYPGYASLDKILGISMIVVSVIAWVLILVSIFGWRRKKLEQPQNNPESV